MRMPTLNIISQLVLYLVFAISLNLWHPQYLLVFLLVTLCMLVGKPHRFYQLSRRLKWFYFFIFLVFALNTPGEHISDKLLPLTPTYEGVIAGVTQVLRIALMLAILSWLLATHTKQTFITGIYFLCSPLKCVGVNAERFAVRLWLTLHYVELNNKTKQAELPVFNLGQRLQQILAQMPDSERYITLENDALTWFDYVIMLLAISTAAFVFIKVKL